MRRPAGRSSPTPPRRAAVGRQSLRIRVENAYPGYRLACDLHFANSGQIPFLVKEIKIVNPRPIDLSITALEGPPARRALKPCGYAPRWGLLAERVPAACRSVVKITLALGPNVSENSRLDFVVQVILAEKQP
jgi:hypothetical protein